MNHHRPPDSFERGRSAVGVFETLRAEIVSLALPPGTALSRADLQARFGLSSTPVRDALMRLQEEDLVDIFPQHATRVTLIDTERARQGQFLRRAVELEVVRTLAIAPAPVAVAPWRALMRRQTAFAEIGDHEAFSQADESFHRSMAEAAGVGRLWALVRRQGGHIDRLRRLHLPVEGKMREILRDHEAIVAAIEARDEASAQHALRSHLSHSLDFVDALREKHAGYFRP